MTVLFLIAGVCAGFAVGAVAVVRACREVDIDGKRVAS